MGQRDVVEWLAEHRRQGTSRFFTVGEIREGLRVRGYGYLNVDLQVSQLYHYGVLEMRRRVPGKKKSVSASYDGWWRRSYRIKAEFVGEKA